MSDAALRSPDAVPRRALGIRIRRVNGDFLIGEEDRALLLTDVARLIFASLDGRRSISDVAHLVANEYAVDEDEALQDVREFLDDLTDKGIVAWKDAP
ncbi:PqqD family protein [Streptomyces europaeiscabiei]|uniref:PqqD family protein n=1 Tax=Streptomyces europaeiscabiei TaxID=146819 RepID=UPI002E17CC49